METKNSLFSTPERIEIVDDSPKAKELDQQRSLLQKSIREVQTSHAALEQQTKKTAGNPDFIFHSTIATIIPWIGPPSSNKLSAKIAAVEESQHDLDNVVAHLGAAHLKELFSSIDESPKKIIIFNDAQGVKETAPISQSFQFGIMIKQELQQLQQKTVTDKLTGAIGPYGKSDLFGDMLADLGRTHKNKAIYSLTEGTTTMHLDQEQAKENLQTFKSFVGENQHLQVAIASLMHQGGQSDFERMKLGAPRDATDQTSLPFFTEGVNSVMWRPHLEGPIFPKLFTGENKQELQIYNLEKIRCPKSSSPVFRLTMICSQSAINSDFNYDLVRNVVYQFEENPSFNAHLPITEGNSPVIVSCLEGKIVQSFDDQRTPEQLAHQSAKYNLAVYQRKLEELGNPEQIQAEYQQRIQFLAGRAAIRAGSIMTQDRNAVEAKLQQLRKAQLDVQTAQQELEDAERNLNGISANEPTSDETNSQLGFEHNEK